MRNNDLGREALLAIRMIVAGHEMNDEAMSNHGWLLAKKIDGVLDLREDLDHWNLSLGEYER